MLVRYRPSHKGMIELTRVSKRFGTVAAVTEATLAVDRGELLALLGPSGCGKTTLMRLLAGFEAPDEGEVRIDGKLVAGPAAWVPPERRHVGMVFQDFALFPHLTVGANVGFGLPRKGRAERVRAVLEIVGLTDCERRYPGELSGGQQQRVALARAVAPAPSVVLLDEPWSNIDPVLRASMRDELAAILRSLGVTVVLVTHDREEALSLADRIALMLAGSVVQAGRPEDVYHAPATRWAAEFVGAANFLPGRIAGDLVETALGRFPVANRNGKTAVDVLVRPELLQLELDASGTAEIVGREFRGHDVLYRVQLGDGTVVLAQRPSTEVVPLGARVTPRPHQHSVTVYA